MYRLHKLSLSESPPFVSAQVYATNPVPPLSTVAIHIVIQDDQSTADSGGTGRRALRALEAALVAAP